jgi:hypothetical protein
MRWILESVLVALVVAALLGGWIARRREPLFAAEMAVDARIGQ